MAAEAHRFTPDYAVPPGETLQEVLESNGMSQADLARRTGRPLKTINEIVQGKAAITPETALQLERALGLPASFWNTRESRYREALARLEESRKLATWADWSSRFPLRAMVKLGWIQERKPPADQLRELLNFFGVSSPTQWEALWLGEQVAFRRSRAFASDPYATSAWLRQGERQAQAIPCEPFDTQAFKLALGQIRRLTREPVDVSTTGTVDLCARAGVALTFVHELPKLRASGASRWLTPLKALVQLSLRYKSDDQLWFSFFHEAGHVLKHGKTRVFVDDGATAEGDAEEEANRFAAETLVPSTEMRKLTAGGRRPSKAEVLTFAKQQGVAPGVVVGRLQHDRLLPFTHLNDLKRRIDWAEAGQ